MAEYQEPLIVQKNPSISTTENVSLDKDSNFGVNHRSVYTRGLQRANMPSGLVRAWQVYEDFRWKVAFFMGRHPFGCCIKNSDSPNKIADFFGTITLGDMLIWAVFIGVQPLIILQGYTLNIQPCPVWKKGVEEGSSAREDFAQLIGSYSALVFMFAWMMGVRNSVWEPVLGISFERSIKYHRWFARYGIVLALVHGIDFIHVWYTCGGGGQNSPRHSTAEVIRKSLDGESITGWIAVILGILIWMLSWNCCRRGCFEWFLRFHWILFIPFVLIAIAHGAGALGFALLLWGVDLAYRAYINFSAAKRVDVLSMKLLPGNVVRIEYSKSNFDYEAGQYAFVNIPQVGMLEWHPFSLSTCPTDPSVMMHIRVLGDWCERLKEFAQTSTQADIQHLSVYVEGPYGTVSVPLHTYEHIILISGGIGITPMQSIFNELVHDIGRGRPAKYIHFVWSVRDPTVLEEFANKHHWAAASDAPASMKQADENAGVEHSKQQVLPQWFQPDMLLYHNAEDVNENISLVNVSVTTDFYLTRSTDEQKEKIREEYGTIMKFGRPDVNNILAEARHRAGSDRVAVLCCGPGALVDSVVRSAVMHDVDCHTEVFEF